MPNVIAFPSGPRASQPPVPTPIPVLDIRPHLEGAAQTALDAADAIIAALNCLDGTGETDASPTAMAAHAGEVVQIREPAAPVEPEPGPTPVQQEASPADPDPVPEEIAAPTPKPIILPWRGAGNIISATGCAVLVLIAWS